MILSKCGKLMGVKEGDEIDTMRRQKRKNQVI